MRNPAIRRLARRAPFTFGVIVLVFSPYILAAALLWAFAYCIAALLDAAGAR